MSHVVRLGLVLCAGIVASFVGCTELGPNSRPQKPWGAYSLMGNNIGSLASGVDPALTNA
jgi:hypothetical protein